LLRGAGFEPDVVVSGVDESVVVTEDPAELALSLARLKARAVAGSLEGEAGALVLGCDSVLAFGGEIWGKPEDAAEAVRRWEAMRGKSGVLYTGHCLIRVGDGECAEEVGATVVHFSRVSDREVADYVASGEPLQVAGAFTIDGRGGAFVERIEGDHGNVVGLSLPVFRRLLGALGVSVAQLWKAS
jgi:septum formation protein